MALSKIINVMISSRCNDTIPISGPDSIKLSDVRLKLKEIIQKELLFNKKIFEVWINECQPPQGGEWSSEEVCLDAVKECDILLVLYNGNAGWADHAGIGICHAELHQAMEIAPGKIKFIEVEGKNFEDYDLLEQERNRRFQEYVKSLNLFRGSKVCKNSDDIIQLVKDSMHDICQKLVINGVRYAEQGNIILVIL